MHRFFVPPELFAQDKIVISGKLVRQINYVLRLKVNDHIILFDNTGFEYEVELNHFSKDIVETSLVSKRQCVTEPCNIRITLYQALLKLHKFEFVLQKCTEIGITGFVPLKCDFCVGQYSEAKATRWENIITEATEQSRRGKVPVLFPVIDFKDACISSRGISLLAWEKEENTSLVDLVQQLKKTNSTTPLEVNLFIGPEGGFSSQEIEIAQNAGFTTFSLGQRIFKADTAGIVTASVLLYEFRDI